MPITNENFWQVVCEYRGVQDPCPKCDGLGVQVYANTAGWSGGIGGQTPTSGVCSSCWGSGDKNKPWLNLRDLDSKIKKLAQEEGEKYLEKTIGARYYERKYFASVCDLLDKESRKRKHEYDYKSFLMRLSGIIKQFGNKKEDK